MGVSHDQIMSIVNPFGLNNNNSTFLAGAFPGSKLTTKVYKPIRGGGNPTTTTLGFDEFIDQQAKP